MNEIKDVHREYIKREAAKIKSQVIGGYLYGEPVTEDDIEAMLVAAYFLGIRKESEASSDNNTRHLFELFA